MRKIKALKAFSKGKTLEKVSIYVENQTIQRVEERSFDDFDYDYECIAPAFFDTHINGGYEHYFTQSISQEALYDIARSSRDHATAYTLPCLITSSLENILAGIEEVKNCPQEGIVGLHLEGPFLNIKKRGAHLAKYVRMPTDAEISKILNQGADVIKIWTIAPENFTQKQLFMIQEAGVTLSAGHSNATYNESKKAFGCGIELVTHLYNAMSPLHHRDPGLIGATLEDSDVWAPIIPDGKHCNWGAARIAYKCKREKLFLISDALFLGRKKKEFQWEEFDARLENNSYINSEGNLAGAAISLAEGVRNAVEFIGIPLEEALSMATDRPAQAIGLENKLGSLDAGFPAAIVGFSESKLDFQIIEC